MCMLGKIAKGAASIAPFGALGLGASLFGKKKKSVVNNFYADPFNPRGSYVDKAGNTVVPAEVMTANRAAASGTGLAPPSLFAKRG